MTQCPVLRRALPGIALVCLGWALLALMTVFPERLRVPATIGHLVAATLVLAGLLALANVFGGRRLRSWLAVALLSCMVAPSIWIAVGPGQRACSIQVPLLRGAAGDGLCRTAFGIGSVLGLLMLLVALRHALAPRTDKSSPPTR